MSQNGNRLIPITKMFNRVVEHMFATIVRMVILQIYCIHIVHNEVIP